MLHTEKMAADAMVAVQKVLAICSAPCGGGDLCTCVHVQVIQLRDELAGSKQREVNLKASCQHSLSEISVLKMEIDRLKEEVASHAQQTDVCAVTLMALSLLVSVRLCNVITVL